VIFFSVVLLEGVEDLLLEEEDLSLSELLLSSDFAFFFLESCMRVGFFFRLTAA
jgi:hypothetical protein